MAHVVVAPAYGSPDVLKLTRDSPAPPGPGEVLLEVRAAGVNPSDWKSYSGAWGQDPAKLPLRIGYEAAGVVRAVGPDVDGVQVGDEVIAYPASGAYTDELVVKATSLVPKPSSMSWEKAAGLMLAGVTAAHAVAATRIGAGDTVLVHGASGAVGAMAVQLAHAKGARVVGTAHPSNHEYLTDLGATPVAYGRGLADRVRAAAPQGISAAIDAAGTDEALDVSVALVPDRHRIATVANSTHGGRLGVQVLGSGAGADPGTAIRKAARSDLTRLWEAGRVDVKVGRTYHLADAAKAHRVGMEGSVRGKLVLLP